MRSDKEYEESVKEIHAGKGRIGQVRHVSKDAVKVLDKDTLQKQGKSSSKLLSSTKK